MSKRLILRIAFAMLAVALALEGMPKRATAANSGSNSPSYKAENCQKIYVPGPEDVTIDQSIGQAFISSCDRWGKHAKGGSPGAIYVLDLEILNPQAVGQPRRLSFDLEKERFCPGGISLHRGEDGERMLFVVNRLEDGDHSVEIFSLEQDQLHHLGSVEDPDFLTSPNDVTAIDPTRFLVTNDFGSRGKFVQAVEALLGPPRGSVVYYEKGTSSWRNGSFSRVAEGIPLANGIAFDPMRERLYVAVAGDSKLLAYEWKKEVPNRPLASPEKISVPGMPDNLEWDEAGDLWIGVHPDPFALMLHVVTKGWVKRKAPSMILRLHIPKGAPPSYETVFWDDGSNLSASSVGAAYEAGGKHLLVIGAPFDDHLLLCELPDVKSSSVQASRPL